MKILNFECSKIHGYLTFSIDFSGELTFLTGINGSGKTSAVRAITALLAPSFRDLATLDYEGLSVTVNDGIETKISARKADEQIVLICSDVEEDLKIPVLPTDSYETRGRFSERERDFYREQEAINARHPVLARIENLPTPMFLDLERRHQVGTRQRIEAGLYNRHILANPLAGSLLESLRDAQALAEDTFRKFLAKRAQLTDDLKQEIILTAFEPGRNKDDGFGLALPGPEFMSDLHRNEEVVQNSLSQIGISADRIANTVEPFFLHAKQVAARVPVGKELRKKIEKSDFKDIQEWSAIHPKMRQIERLVELISKYNGEVVAAKKRVERYRNSINGFLADSGKELFFDDSGNLKVMVTAQPSARPITALSSGERQLVVILTHLAFNRQARRANVLIIDEPELSLHLRWQELFVDAVRSASSGIQLILATHSPSIIKGRIDSCVDIEEARKT